MRNWERLEKRVKEALRETVRRRSEEKGREIKEQWWDEEYVKKKREVRKKLKQWRKVGGNEI